MYHNSPLGDMYLMGMFMPYVLIHLILPEHRSTRGRHAGGLVANTNVAFVLGQSHRARKCSLPRPRRGEQALHEWRRGVLGLGSLGVRAGFSEEKTLDHEGQ